MIIQQQTKKIFYLLILMTGMWVLNACEVNHSLDPDKYANVYMPLARNTPVELAAITGIDTTLTITYGATYGGPGEPAKDITVSFSVEPALVDSFNTDQGTAYPILPDNAYELGKTSAVIPAGESFTPELKLTINGNVDIKEQQYLLPVTMEVKTAGVPINKNLKTAYFLITTDKVEPVQTPIIITGFMINPYGSDSPVKGTEKYGKFTLRGGMEYIQLMALRDIDFSQTPYSLVVGRHYGPLEKGWASGKDMTFKFNLTEGTAEQGTFFYVGGALRRIDGYRESGLSTDISDANWIRYLQTNLGEDGAVAGDGFGWSTSGLLPNTEEAVGIAVFEGTEVTATSVPLDAVFYGSEVNGALKGNNGFLVPDNGLYSPVNEKTGEPQSLFGQGTNIFMIEYSGNFIQLGGVFTEKAILKSRKSPYVYNTKIDTQLEEIESGEATEFIGR